jgi:hypothetical protein
MKRLFCATVLLFVMGFGFAQGTSYWKEAGTNLRSARLSIKNQPENFKVFELNVSTINGLLDKCPDRGLTYGRTDEIIEFPDTEGNLKKFRVMEASVMHPDLAAKYPGIRSYAGQGVDDPGLTIRFSISDQKGLHAMIRSTEKSTCFIDPYTEDRQNYMVYARKDLSEAGRDFDCQTLSEEVEDHLEDHRGTDARTNDKKLRKYRLALSCTAEYGNLFASSGTDAQKKANILAQMNITLTRVNGIYEQDLAVTLELVPNNDLLLFYGSTSDDPWTTEYNNTTQNVNDNIIGDANYDIGHNFNTTGGGNAGCIACVGITGSKGMGYTGRSNPTGDAFDIDYVAHEMGHQFGGYHIMNTCARSGSGSTEVEPASGSTIMGYAGICSSNIQSNSDDYFAYVNIRDISDNIQFGNSSDCGQIIPLTNNPPIVYAGVDYTIPKSTPFVLTGIAQDADGDVLTYTWEQNDPERAPEGGLPQPTWAEGPMFRSYKGTNSPKRYFPKIEHVVAGNLAPTWEVIPSVARTMEFSLTVRDNHAGGGQTSDDLMKVTVDGNAGPFVVTYPNTNVTWNPGSTQTVNWDIAGTNSAPVNCSTVNILLSLDGGFTYPVTLLSSTPNDGSASITVPNYNSANCRVMVEAADNIFYDMSNANFSIGGAVSCNASEPTGLTTTDVLYNMAYLNWNEVSGTTYDVRYRKTGTATWSTAASSHTQLILSGLSPVTSYEAQVRSVCPVSTSSYSTSHTFITPTFENQYCASKGKDVRYEYIGRVRVGTIDNSSNGGTGYTDFNSLSTDLEAGSEYSITVTPVWTGRAYSEAYAAWIDYNQDGDFEDAGEKVWSRSATTSTSVSGAFTIPSEATSGITRLRVSMKYNGIPGPCETFSYGEVEDYRVNINTGGFRDVQPPTVPGGITVSSVTTSRAAISWNASTDNVGVTNYHIYVDNVFKGSTMSTSYALENLSDATSYNVGISALDAEENESAKGNVSFMTDEKTVPEQSGDGVTLVLNFDDYPQETSWSIVNDNDAVMAEGNNYAFGTTLEVETPLPSGCYTFTINDSYGDGICCRYGSGSYSLTAGSAIVAEGGSFTYSESTEFCLGSSSKPHDIYTKQNGVTNTESKVFPNPVRDRLNIQISDGVVRNVNVYSVNGVLMGQLDLNNNQADVSWLKSGIYLLTIETYKEILREKFIKE